MAEGPGPTVEGGGGGATNGDHKHNGESTRESRKEGVETMAEGPGPRVDVEGDRTTYRDHIYSIGSTRESRHLVVV